MRCEYCNGKEENEVLLTTKATEDENDFNIYVSANSPNLIAMSTNFVHTSSVKINYCPMCGRRLGEE